MADRRRARWEADFHAADTDGDGRIDMKQFVAIMELGEQRDERHKRLRSSSSAREVIGMPPPPPIILTTVSAAHFPPPTDKEKADAEEAAVNRGCPRLPQGIEWGYFDKKKKHFCLWCGACGVYVAIMKGNEQHAVFEITEDGRCAHWTYSIFQKFKGEAIRVLLHD